MAQRRVCNPANTPSARRARAEVGEQAEAFYPYAGARDARFAELDALIDRENRREKQRLDRAHGAQAAL